MPPNYSDTSDDESSSYTTTNVLLGYASKEPTDDTFSQLGGYPSWLDDTSAPSAELAKCKICSGMMTLLLQLNGDLPERFLGHERKLYIFSCRRKACRKKEGTMRAIRGVRISKSSHSNPKAKGKATEVETPPKQDCPPPNLGDSLFNSTFSSNTSHSNPFSSSTPQSPTANPFAPQQPSTTTSPFSSLASKAPQPPPTPDLSTTFAQKARISTATPAPSTKEPWPSPSSLPQPYPSYHLDADYESLDPDPPSSSKTAMDIDTEGSSSKDDEKDAFESTIDKTFQKFADRLAQNPEQVLRYVFGGTPLLYSKSDPVGKMFSSSAAEAGSNKVKTISQGAGRITRCPSCGANRVFELQLVPQAIAELEVEEEGLEGMEWGTVILGVCEKDCGEKVVDDGDVGWVEEWVGVQWEESGEVKKG